MSMSYKNDYGKVVIDKEVFVIIQYGTKVSVVAENMIDRIKYDVESQTGLKVKKISVNVQGVRVSN